MKKIIAKAIVFIVMCNANYVFAELWESRTFDFGETIYGSGRYDRLLVGQRGVGFMTTQALHDRQSVSLKIDDSNPTSENINLLYTLGNTGNTYLFKNSNEILPLLLKAKQIEISFNSCGSALKSSPLDCLFTAKGQPYSVVWDFDKPLSTLFDPNNQSR